MSIHHTITEPPLSKPPRLRFVADMPVEDSTLDVSDAWREETQEDAEATAYFSHSHDTCGTVYADLIGLKVQSDISLDLFTHDGAVAFMTWDTVLRLENVQTVRINE